MVEYRDRLLAAMNDRGVSAKELADKHGMTYQAVKKVLDGKSAAFNAVNHALVSKYLKVRSDWLALGEGPMRDEGVASSWQWPFPSISAEKIFSLTHDERARLEGALLFAASQLGFKDITEKKSEPAA